MDYDVTLIGEICHGEHRVDDQGRLFRSPASARVPSRFPSAARTTSVPMSPSPSRSTITCGSKRLVELVETEASCELYGLLKRPDEKYVTERAYDNPKFVEDMVRDVAARLNAEPRIDAYVIESKTSSRSTTTRLMR
jgi:GTP cyclohydrolase I